jgi:hypothetical protein
VGSIGTFSFFPPTSYSAITPTAEGLSIGITNSLDVCCWHDEYQSFPSFLDVLATNDANARPAAIGGSPVIIAPGCTPAGLEIGTGLNLVADSGDPDLFWSVVSGPTIGPAYPVAKPVAWVAPPSPTNWIDPNDTNGLNSDPAGDYEFEAVFSAPAGTTTLTLDFDFAVDNNIVIELDGVPIPGATLTGSGSGNFTALHSPANYVVTGAAAAGQHTLTATVDNDDGPIGFLLDGTATCTGTTPPPTCTTVEPGAGASAPSAQCHDVDVRICYGGSAPTGGVLGCNGGSEELVPASTLVTQYTLQNMPAGHRLPDCGAHFVRDLNCGRSLSVTYSPAAWSYGTPGGNWGDIYGVADVSCNIISDVLAGLGGPGGGVGGWPNPTTWAPYTTSQVVTPTWMNNGDSRLVPPSFTVLGTEQATGTNVWVGGFAPLTMPSPYPWTITTAQSPYPSASGLKLTWNVIGDPLKPTNVNDSCVDSRWAHVHRNSAQWTTPSAPGLYPRWTIVQTMQDIRSGIIHRTVDLHCVGVAPVPPDADADCLSDAADLNDANQDQDGDLLVDGIDVANGSNPASADTDGDGASDFDELFTFTDPTDNDTDNDGQLDRLDVIAISGVGDTGDSTDLTDDNCPTMPNADQLNTDSLAYASGGAHYGDRTQPQQDWMGNVCDRDMDNDHLYNVTESAFLMSGVNCLSGSGTTTNPSKADSDLSVPASPNGADQAVDGAECALGSNPTLYTSTFGLCTTGSGGTDFPDIDRLCYHPGGAGAHSFIENFWRTRDISGFPAELEHGCAPPPRIQGCIDTFIGETDRDSDGDGLPDGTEVKYYATNPSNADTDSDSCPDGKEVADLSGDGNTNSGDQGLLAAAFSLPAWDPNRIARDITKDGFVNSGDQGFLASFITLGGGACPVRTGIVITRSRQ